MDDAMDNGMSGENSSFQNRGPGKRSEDCVVLMDVTNSCKKACKVKAAEAMYSRSLTYVFASLKVAVLHQVSTAA